MTDKFVHSQPLEQVDNGTRFYERNRIGPGRWLTISRIGVLWTNDSDSTQLRDIDGPVDSDEASKVAHWLNEMATTGLSASDAFDAVSADHADLKIQSGDLASLA